MKKGDTLFAIARSLSVPLPKILELNGITERSRIKVGQKLFIPQDRGAGQTVEATSLQSVQQQNPARTSAQRDPGCRCAGASFRVASPGQA